jgi:two-component system sensor histidine kinase VicK
VDHLQRLVSTVRAWLILLFVVYDVMIVGIWWLFVSQLHPHFTNFALLIGLSVISPILAIGFGVFIAAIVTSPIKAIWQSVLHLSPTDHGVPSPNMKSVRIGRDLVSSLNAQVYQLANTAQNVENAAFQKNKDLAGNFVASNLPLPLIVLNKYDMLQYANASAAKYLGQPLAELIGKNINTLLDMSFQDNDTFDTWLRKAKDESAVSNKSWERVKVTLPDKTVKLFDLAAFYNRDNPENTETMMVLFDHSVQYGHDDEAMTFLAMSVHELRTPLTLLRGYIEAFEDELGSKLTPEQTDFMYKMHASSQQLAAFVNNILNVARVEGDQLLLELQEEDWSDVIRSAANNLALRAKVRGITLEYSVEENLPTVGVDRVSIYEVISNLVDNAIKYSGESKRIQIRAHMTKDGFVETTIQDWGMGINSSSMPNLFSKFYRNHRNRSQIGGTGLGLYLSKAIVAAHGGNIWVRSKENEGSTFGFTVLPYGKLAEEQKQGNTNGIVRGAHGWIKNHSMYRR